MCRTCTSSTRRRVGCAEQSAGDGEARQQAGRLLDSHGECSSLRADRPGSRSLGDAPDRNAAAVGNPCGSSLGDPDDADGMAPHRRRACGQTHRDPQADPCNLAVLQTNPSTAPGRRSPSTRSPRSPSAACATSSASCCRPRTRATRAAGRSRPRRRRHHRHRPRATRANGARERLTTTLRRRAATRATRIVFVLLGKGCTPRAAREDARL